MAPLDSPPTTKATARLRLYIARSTPNSVRAEHNLAAVLDGFKTRLVPLDLEIIDVFAQPKRAITDGVVATPTLIGLAADRRIVLMGDLADWTQVKGALEGLLASPL